MGLGRLRDGLAPTPPMGWNSWNRFQTKIDERLIRETAEAMVETGMRDAGYRYVVIDDGWEAPERDASGDILADPDRFGSGIAALADRIHGLDLRFGIYTDAGTKTCLAPFAGPDGWNDPDMLEVGNGGMTLDEYRAHFSLWCLLAAPLMAGNDLRAMSEEVRDILTAPEVIAVDQDPLGRQGDLVRADGDAEIWAKELADGSQAVVLFDRAPQPREIAIRWAELGWDPRERVAVRDLWQRADVATTAEGHSTTVPAHGAVMLRLAREGAM